MTAHLQLVDSDRPHQAEPRPLLGTVSDIAKETGVARSTLYELMASGSAPGAVRFGRRILIHRPTFIKWLEEQARGAQ